MQKVYAGIDLGGTKIEGVVFKGEKAEQILFRKRIATEADKGYSQILSNLTKMISMMETESQQVLSEIGLGIPGCIDKKSGNVKNANTTSLNGKALKDDLESRSAKKIKVSNDANCFALAEYNLGVVQEAQIEAQVMLGLILGTGVGGGLVINGQVVNGKHGIGGEWGHNFLDMSGGDCYCGKRGCVEKLISGTALTEWYALKSGINRPLKEIVERAREGNDIIAKDTLERLIDFFGKGLANVINILDPEVIVIGGGVGNIEELYTEEARKSIENYMFNHEFNGKILKPKLGDSAGVFGAAFL